MPTIKKYDPRNEKELHSIIEKELDALEEGLQLLKYEMNMGSGIPDFLCVDNKGRLVIIEVKLEEDEYVLYQALRYYSDVFRNRYQIVQLFPKYKIDPEQNPRVVLIAKRFPDDIRFLTTFVSADVELLEYTVIEDSTGKKGITYHQITLPKLDVPSDRLTTIQDHRDYLNKEELKPIFDGMRKAITEIFNDVAEYVTGNYLGYKFKGRQIAWIECHKNSIDIGSHIIDEKFQLLDYDRIRVESKKDDYQPIIEKIAKSYVNLGGKIE